MIKISEWELVIQNYLVDYRQRYVYLKKLFNWLENNQLYIGNGISTYSYSDKMVKEFRGNLYYKNIALCKLIIQIQLDSEDDLLNVRFMEIHKKEYDTEKLTEISYELVSDLNDLLIGKEFMLDKQGYIEIINIIQAITARILELTNKYKTFSGKDVFEFLTGLIDDGILIKEDLCQENIESDTIDRIIKIMEEKNIYKIISSDWYLTVNSEYFNRRVPKKYKIGNIKKDKFALKYIFKNQNFISDIASYVKISEKRNGLRVVSFKIFDGYLKDFNLEFGQADILNDESHYTIFIGQNGTCKTAALTSIQKAFEIIYSCKYGNEVISKFDFYIKYIIGDNTFEFEYINSLANVKINSREASTDQIIHPQKVMACSYMINDKFSYYPSSNYDESDSNNYYEYLGVRDATNASHTSTISKRLVLNIIKSVLNSEFKDNLSTVLKYLKLDNKIKITMQVNEKRCYKDGKFNDYIVINFIKSKFKDIDEADVLLYLDYLHNIIKIDNEEKKDDKYFSISYEVDLSEEINDNQLAKLDLAYYLIIINILNKPEVEIKKKDFFKVEHASSGENHFLFTMINILAHIDKNSLVLIDEPEISLHPNWQYKYVYILNQLFKKYECYFIIATHSHFIVSDLPQNQSTIVSFERDEYGIKARMLENTDTYGWSAENILYNIFKMPGNRNYYLADELDKILSNIRNGNLDKVREKIVELMKLKETLLDSDPLKEVIERINRKVKSDETAI